MTESKSELLVRAENFRNAGHYAEALSLFDSISKTKILSQNELGIAKANVLLCKLLSDERLSNLAPSLHGLPPVYNSIVNGILKFRNGNSAAYDFLLAKNLLSKNRNETFEYFLIMELLAKNYRVIDGEMDSAFHYFKKALDFAKQYEALSPHVARLLYQSAEVCIVNRDAVTGMGYINEALRSPMDSLLLSKSLVLKGTIFRKLEQFDSADLFYEQANQLIVRNQLEEVLPSLLSEKMLLSIFMNKDSIFFKQLQALRTVCKANKISSFRANRLLGYYYSERHDIDKSITYYELAIGDLKMEKSPELVTYMESLYQLADQYTTIGKFEKAEQYTYKSLVFTTALRNEPYTWQNVKHPLVVNELYNFVNYNLLARIIAGKASGSKGNVKFYKQALEIYLLIDSTMQTQLRAIEEDALLAFLDIGDDVYDGAIETCYNLYELTQDTIYLNRTHHFMERSKGLIIYRDILARSSEYFPEVPASFKTKELEFKSKISALKRSSSFHSPDLNNVLKQMDSYYAEMEGKYPDYYKAKYKVTIPSFGHFQHLSYKRKLDILQYHYSGKFIYLLSYGSRPLFTRINIDSVFTKALATVQHEMRHRPDLKVRGNEIRFSKSAHFLYTKLIVPIKPINRQLLIIPDGELNSMPFEILVSDTLTFKRTHYFVEDVNITYSQSLRAFELALLNRKENVQSILAFNYGKSSGNLPVLTGTKKEVEEMQKIFYREEVSVREGRQITRTHLLQDLQGNFDLIHIALHASSSTRDRLDNKILCSDGHVITPVYGFEVAPLKISAHTVVLSGCESAFGPELRGEGTYSLTRAFMQAGAKTVISSLWNLSDYSTSEITGNFYKHIHAGQTPSESLSQAKREYLATADENTSHPYFWGGLICFGS